MFSAIVAVITWLCTLYVAFDVGRDRSSIRRAQLESQVEHQSNVIANLNNTLLNTRNDLIKAVECAKHYRRKAELLSR